MKKKTPKKNAKSKAVRPKPQLVKLNDAVAPADTQPATVSEEPPKPRSRLALIPLYRDEAEWRAVRESAGFTDQDDPPPEAA